MELDPSPAKIPGEGKGVKMFRESGGSLDIVPIWREYRSCLSGAWRPLHPIEVITSRRPNVIVTRKRLDDASCRVHRIACRRYYAFDNTVPGRDDEPS